MKNEIKVGEYVRTKRGIIDRVVKILDNYIFLKSKFFITEYGGSCTFIKKTDVVKHSSNLIDLIECGDYVNGSKVLDVMEDMKTGEVNLEMTMNYTNEELGDCTIYNKDIKTIVTKEMMESISYRATKM